MRTASLERRRDTQRVISRSLPPYYPFLDNFVGLPPEPAFHNASSGIYLIGILCHFHLRFCVVLHRRETMNHAFPDLVS